MVLQIQSYVRDSLENKTRSARPIAVTDEKNVQRVWELIEADPRLTYEDVKYLMNISSASVNNILHKYLRVKKVLCR